MSFVLVLNTSWQIFEIFTPFLKSCAANSNVSDVTDEYWNPPVSVIIPDYKHVPSSLSISIPKYSNIPINTWQQAGATGST